MKIIVYSHCLGIGLVLVKRFKTKILYSIVANRHQEKKKKKVLDAKWDLLRLNKIDTVEIA
jgi:hypothetical protein